MNELRKEVKVYNVYAKCSDSNCTGFYIENNPFIVWDNKNTTSLSDDTFSYSYICSVCSGTVIDSKKYPYQEFIEI
jgi:hypothetical protein